MFADDNDRPQSQPAPAPGPPGSGPSPDNSTSDISDDDDANNDTDTATPVADTVNGSTVDEVGKSDKYKLRMISMEYIKDAIYKIGQTEGLRDEYKDETAFEVGYVLGNIREKYRRMMAHYKQIWDRYRGRTVMLGPSIDKMTAYHYLINYEWVHMVELDIEKLVEMLEGIPEEDLEPPKQRRRGRKKKTLRAMEEEVAEERTRENNFKQEKLKSTNRQRHLLRRLGLSPNASTTKKRFLRRWPVEDTWDTVRDMY